MNLVDGAFRKSFHKLVAVELIVGPSCLEDLILILEAEVGVGVIRVNVLLVQIEHLVVRDDTRVAEVVYPAELLVCHDKAGGEELVKDSHGVRDIHHLVVLDDFSYEVAGGKVVGDWHANSENESAGVDLEHLLNHSLGF